jgi:hypothetical protein
MTVQQGNPRRILPLEASALLLSMCRSEILISGFLRLDLCAISSISKKPIPLSVIPCHSNMSITYFAKRSS